MQINIEVPFNYEIFKSKNLYGWRNIISDIMDAGFNTEPNAIVAAWFYELKNDFISNDDAETIGWKLKSYKNNENATDFTINFSEILKEIINGSN